ncbi:MAG: asparagine synthase (glutamine-hydrolyzing) [Geothrix sp.]|uniref:asparagine synthase (glutamine-hydrolyzing) n=1 Tax=Geothrix sp. TaxID=1962974 RepID=UPI0018137281|nr:asparagine synthase (glutamine-hydrolyzing) [Geothrix sp.]NWJ42551.1 asparagine synthase (glutamine-hydrolyzing) [Geothrix sp.]WIL19488.1 MAG: asparagine synthase (glutamine-hydrolyzing) [Geothrix sp.]
MCGIFGEINLAGPGFDLGSARRALDSIRHRGPDDEGWVCINTGRGAAVPFAGPDTMPELQLPSIGQADPAAFDVCLGFRRLSILDLSSAGHQPMRSADGTCWIVFNGEVYNFIELRRELEALGHVFRSQGDTEVLLAGYQAWGRGVFSRLEGMFAFCLVDLQRGDVLLGRDHFGIKPLYYTFANGRLLFASEIRCLLCYPDVARRLNPEALFRYLRLGSSDGHPETMIRGIWQVPPGSYGLLNRGGKSLDLTRYWALDPDRTAACSLEEASRAVRSRLEESVLLHLRSDVPLGSCLSGGLDSTTLVMLMKGLLEPGHPVDCFTFITDDPVLSEQRFVDVASAAAQVNLHTVAPTPQEFSRDMADLIRTQELPFGGPTVYAQYRVFRLARESGMTVMLDGQGADELFGGYYTYLGARIAEDLCRLSFGKVAGVLRNTPGNQRQYFFRMLAFAFARLLPSGLRPLIRPLAGEPLFPDWLRKSWFLERGFPGVERTAGSGANALKRELALSVQEGSLPALLRYEDRNSMRFSIESRVPFCNHRLAELAFSLPSDHLISGRGVTKSVLREAARGLVPDFIIDREKVGFGTPDRTWLSAIRGHVDAVVSEGEAMDLPFLTHIRRETAHALDASGVWPAHAWRIFNLIEWMKAFDIQVE